MMREKQDLPAHAGGSRTEHGYSKGKGVAPVGAPADARPRARPPPRVGLHAGVAA